MCHIDYRHIDRTTYITLKAHKETFNGLMQESKTVNEHLKLTDINYLIGLLNARLTHINETCVCNGALTFEFARALNKEVELIEKNLQHLNNICTIDTL